jgi:hypothetical protein
MMKQTSHALENKYDAEDDAKTNKQHTKAKRRNFQSTNLEKLPSPTGWRIISYAF